MAGHAPQPVPGQPIPVQPRPRDRVRRVARHRATQLVAVGVLGIVLGACAVALFDHDGGRDNGRGGYSHYDGRGGVPGFGGRFER